MDWDKLKIFYCVAKSGSFTKAASHLEVSQSAVSRQISGLEMMLDTPLFHRHARGLILTEQGEMLYKTTREVFGELAMVEAQIKDQTDLPQGDLKITAPIGLGNVWISPRLPRFLKDHPLLRLTLLVSDNPFDLTLHEADISITSELIDDESLIYKPLMTHTMKIYSSRDYLLKFGVPLSPEQLSRHRLLAFEDENMVPATNTNWLLTCGAKPGEKHEAYIKINNLFGIGQALKGGAGIGLLTQYIAEQCGGLVQIFPDLETPVVTFYFAYPRQLENSKRIDALYQFLLSEVDIYNKEHDIA